MADIGEVAGFSRMAVTEAQILQALKGVRDAERGADIVSLGMVQGIAIRDGSVSFSIAVDSRSVAFAARTVRMAAIARCTPAATSPTFSCCSRLATRMRPESAPTTAIATAITSTVVPSSTGSMIAMPMIAPTNTTAPPSASTSPWVSTA